jgi:hypothetical protein
MVVLALSLAAALWIATQSGQPGDDQGKVADGRGRFRAQSAGSVALDDDFSQAPFEVQKRMARRLLGLSPAALRGEMDGMNDSVKMAFRIAVRALAAADINTGGDTKLLEFLILNPWIISSDGAFDLLVGTKSPAGPAADFEMKNRLLGLLLDANPDKKKEPRRRTQMLQSFGAIHGAEAAKAGWLPPVEGGELVAYVRGVAQGTAQREVVLANLSLAESRADHAEAVAVGMSELLGADAQATSGLLAAMPASATRDLAIFEMVKWLVKVGSKKECPVWIKAIGSDEIRGLAEEAMSGQ